MSLARQQVIVPQDEMVRIVEIDPDNRDHIGEVTTAKYLKALDALRRNDITFGDVGFRGAVPGFEDTNWSWVVLTNFIAIHLPNQMLEKVK